MTCKGFLDGFGIVGFIGILGQRAKGLGEGYDPLPQGTTSHLASQLYIRYTWKMWQISEMDLKKEKTSSTSRHKSMPRSFLDAFFSVELKTNVARDSSLTHGFQLRKIAPKPIIKKVQLKSWKKVSQKKEKRLTEQPKNSRKQQVQYKWFLKVTHFRKSTLQLKLLLSMRKWICCVFPTQGSYFGFGVQGTISFQSFSILSFCSPISSWHRGVTALGGKDLGS